jgi:uncharacterized protein (DUF488 family)
MSEPFFTIGHSNRSFDELLALVGPNGIETIVDVRKFPMSRTHPQFNREALAPALARHGIGYAHMEALGGRRGRSKDIAPEVNGFWDNQSFHNYADYAMGPEFHRALGDLVALGRGKRIAVMCSEAVWWRCHRRIITDYLLAGGEDVFHIVSGDVPELANITPEAVARGGHLEYPAQQSGLF